jgi:hypothetical protein
VGKSHELARTCTHTPPEAKWLETGEQKSEKAAKGEEEEEEHEWGRGNGYPGLVDEREYCSDER